MERTCIILKPDAVNRALVGLLIQRFERKGFKIVAMKMEYLKQEKLKEHYAHHKDKPFFGGLVKYMSSIPSVVMVVEGINAVEVVRRMVGATSGREADMGSIRGDYTMSNQQNLIHASGSKEEAEAEIKRFFKPGELQNYHLVRLNMIYSDEERGE